MKKLRWKFGVIALAICVLTAIIVGVVCGTIFGLNGGYDEVPAVFTLSFKTQEGEELYSLQGKAGDAAEIPSPEREGFVFDGWYADPACSNRVIPARVFPAEDIVYYAKFEKLYTLKFYTEGRVELSEIRGVAGSAVSVPAPQKEGFVFRGWYADEKYALPAEPPSRIESDGEFYAKFEKLYTLKFHTDGGNEIADIIGVAGDSVCVADPIKAGHVFVGWCADAACTAPIGLPAFIKTDGEFYAKFEKLHILRFYTDGDGGDFDVAGIAGTPVKIPNPTKAGYLFGGWYADEGRTLPVKVPSVIETDNEYYAKFDKLYTLTFFIDGGNEIADITEIAGTEISVPDPVKEGYVFAGWYSDGERTVRAELPFFMPKQDAAFYAKFEKLFTLRFETDGGEAIPSVTTVAGSPLETLEPVKEGYAFAGWFSDEARSVPVEFPETMPAHDGVLYAKFIRHFTAEFRVGEEVWLRIEDAEGSVLSPSSVPVREGYTFLRWERNGAEVTFPAVLTESAVYTAAFGKNPVLTLYANLPDGSDEAGKAVRREGVYGIRTEVVLQECTATAAGYRFAGWAESATGGVRFFAGSNLSFADDYSLYAVWALGYVLPESGVTVYYTDRAENAVCVRGGEEFPLSVQRNAFGDREVVFTIDGKTLSGRFSENGTIELRDANLFGKFTLPDGGELLLSGYGEAMVSGTELYGESSLVLSDVLLLHTEKGNRYFQIDFEKGKAVGVDNSAAYGTYYSDGMSAFELYDDARYEGESAFYVVHGESLTFYFNGVRSEARYSSDGYFIYAGVVFYRVDGSMQFADGSGRKLSFAPQGTEYTVPARFSFGGEELAGTLRAERSSSGIAFTFFFEEPQRELAMEFALSYGGGIGTFSVLKEEERTYWNNDAESGEHGSVLCLLRMRDAEEEHVTVFGTVCETEPLQPFEISARKITASENLVLTDGDRDGVNYTFDCRFYTEDGKRLFRCNWYALRAAELNVEGGYSAEILQYVNGRGVPEFEGRANGELLNFAFKKKGVELPLGSPFVGEGGAEIYHILTGEFQGRYELTKTTDSRGLITAISCMRCDVALSDAGNAVLGYGCEGEIYDLYVSNGAGGYRVAGVPQKSAISEGEALLDYGNGLLFVWEPEFARLTACARYVFTENGVTVSALAGEYAERVFRVAVSENGVEGEVTPCDGAWIWEREYDRVFVRFGFENGISAHIEKVLCELVLRQDGTELTYTMSAFGELCEVKSLRADGEDYEIVGIETLVLDEGECLRLIAQDKRNRAERNWLFRVEARIGELFEAERKEAETDGAKFFFLSRGAWYTVLPEAYLYRPSRKEYVLFRGRAEKAGGDEWVWKIEEGELGGLRVTIAVTRSSNLLRPFSVAVENLPAAYACLSESGEEVARAEVYLNGEASLVITHFVLHGEECSAGKTVALGEDRWYFPERGFLLCKTEKTLSAVTDNIFLEDGRVSVEVVKISDVEYLPVGLRIDGDARTGTFADMDGGVWLWRTKNETYTIALSGNATSLQVFEGNAELVQVSFESAGERFARFAKADAPFTLPAPPAREGYRFVGWKWGGQTYAAGACVTLSGRTLFTAVWEEQVCVRFYLDISDAEAYAVLPVGEDGFTQFPEDPVREGYRFKGWYYVDEGDYGMRYNGEYDESCPNVAAKWEQL